MIKIGGNLPDTNYLFLGNYIDGGYYSLECISLLFCLKVRYPNRIILLRGNHENWQVSQVYGLYDECISKYGNPNVWKYLVEVFDYLPFTAVVESKIFCVHSGLSPRIESLDQINELERQRETLQDSPLRDLLESSPDEDRIGWAQAPRPKCGGSFIFGSDITEKFNHVNKLNMIVVGHRLAMDGYFWCHNNQIITIFSAPNYSYRCGNKAAIMEIDEYLNNIILQYSANPIQRRKDQNKDFKKRIPDYFL